MRRVLGILVVVAVLAAGCTINRDIMFKTPVDYEFAPPPDSVERYFRIQPNDFLQFRLFANDGFRMIDLITEEGQRNMQNRNQFTYLVDYDGKVKLPLVNWVPLGGMTLRQAELYLQEKYSEFYNRPFVMLQVMNRRVVVFPGGGGDARVVNLDNNNTTVAEVLAQAGGLAKRGDARRVKLFRRGPDGKRIVYQFDLSDIEGLKYADIVVQGDDIVYVHPNPEIAREVLYDLNPLIALLTTLVLVLGLVEAVKN
jgi:polysaccharide export outer membrane protein